MTISSLKATHPLGIFIRVGMLLEKPAITFSIRGSFDILDENDKKLGAIAEADGTYTVFRDDVHRARLQFRVIFERFWREEEARRNAEQIAADHPEAAPEILEHGARFETKEGISFHNIEHFVSSKPLATYKEALALQKEIAGFQDAELILIERLEAPRATLSIKTDDGKTLKAPSAMRFRPTEPGADRIILRDVLVAAETYWEHFEHQKLRGILEVRVDNEGDLTAINELPLEEYIFSVNYFEMIPDSPPELLKAQTIALRNATLDVVGKLASTPDCHLLADNPYQLYRGSSRETPRTREAALATAGQVIAYKDRICKIRFSKICGGILEDFESAWGEQQLPWMEARPDADPKHSQVEDFAALYPADTEEKARELIDATPPANCYADDEDLPLPLQFTTEYFRWTKRFTDRDLEQALFRNPKYRVGRLKDLRVKSRGASGRIEFLEVEGDRGTVTIGRELEIRKALDPNTLASSCFYPNVMRDEDGYIVAVTLHGAGWGHGVGMCQTGATVMAHRGHSVEDILEHYYPHTRLTRLWGEKPESAAMKKLIARDSVETMDGDRCYEFFNCHRVAVCPVYHEKVNLLAEKTKEGEWRFEPKHLERPLTVMHIECDFLTFEEEVALPKSGQ